MSKELILVVEDDPTMREGICIVLQKAGYQVSSVGDGEQASETFRQEAPDLVVTDLKLPGKSGMELLKEFLQENADLPVILISAFGTIDLAVNALKLGARDFIAKPFSTEELKSKIKQVFNEQRPVKERPETATAGFHGLVGSSAQMQDITRQIRRMAAVDSPVLITGESGTGKELIARAIHQESQRKRKPFLAVNCSALTDTLLASELFGHEKGAFTGAIRQHQGLFEQAHGGTLLLDEIGDISPQLQVKLLRVLQDQHFQRVGGREAIRVDVRVIAATNRNLQQALEERRFREDLYFRLNVLPLKIAPLRERKDDILELVHHFVEVKCHKLGRPVPEITGETLNKLSAYSWPGNIRELENFLERLLIFSENDPILPADIHLDPKPQPSIASGDLNDVLEQVELDMLKAALEQASGVKQRAAQRLGIKTSTLYYKLEKYGLAPNEAGTGIPDDADD